MAERTTTENYGLYLFNENETDLTFSEFRKLLAGNGGDPNSYSNMQKIADLFKTMSVAITQALEDSKAYSREQVNISEDKNSALITKDESGVLTINSDSGSPIAFNDGSTISWLKNGVLSVDGIEVDCVRIVDTLLQYNRGNDHLQLVYSPLGGEQ